LCTDRGYLVSDSELGQSLDEFKQQFGDKPRFVLVALFLCVIGSLLIIDF